METLPAQPVIETASPNAEVVESRARPGLVIRLGGALARRWRWLTKRVDNWFVRLGARFPRVGRLYYGLWSRRFSREQRAFLAGRERFAELSRDPRETSALLRRGIHRLEKGLLMRPRRTVFAVDYIGEVVECYARIVGDPERATAFEERELTWAHDVLTDYFNVVGRHPKIDRCRDRFHGLGGPSRADESRSVPYRRDLSSPPTVGYEELLALAERRRSVRWFLPKRVPRELIERAAAVATQSPSACNRQPFVFRIFDDPALAAKIAAIPAGTVGFSQNVPAVAVVVGQLRHYADERDRHVIYVDGALASMSFVYALETLGLSSCCINWSDIEERERLMDRELSLDPDERPIMLIAFGYPDPEGLVAYSAKKPVARFCRFNFE